ncbi:MAG: hypothetical protein AAF566_06135 [Pseudomonadota bacterium]
MGNSFNIMVVGQRGRLGFEALLFAASLRAMDPGFRGRLIIAEPQPGPLWSFDPRIQNDDVRQALADLGTEIVPFENRHFGESYAHANKAEGLAALPQDEPFVFFDSDTLVTGALSAVAFDFTRPSASMNRENTWPKTELYGPGYTTTWRALYTQFDLNFESSLDTRYPDEHWERYLYFNAGWFMGPEPRSFGARFSDLMAAIRDTPPPELVCQKLFPWLDQIALPLIIHGAGGGRPGPELCGLDGDTTCHWRVMPLFYARARDVALDVLEDVAGLNRLKKVLKQHEPFRLMIYHGRGRKARALFDQEDLPRREAAIRNRLKTEGFWIR